MQSSEACPVLHVDIGPAGAEEGESLAVAVLGGEVERCVPVQLVLVVHGGPGIEQELDNLQVTSCCCQLQ